MSYLRSAALKADTPTDRYPFVLPAVAALAGITFGSFTVLVGDNGTGKSTLIEALAVAAGFNPEGGSRNLMFETHSTHSELADALVLSWTRRPRWGWFLRAETFYGMASHIQQDPYLNGTFPDLHNRSHGESFLALVKSRMVNDGLYLLDEPESALSFSGQLKLLYAMHVAGNEGAQFVLATHSPLLMAYPGAVIYELGDHGASQVSYDDIESVQLWRSFLDRPERFLQHLLADEP
ncbi:MAG: AAA family ATPase [Acidimicrobiales bacterium]